MPGSPWRFAHAESSKNRMSPCRSSSSVRSCREMRTSLMTPPDRIDRMRPPEPKGTASRLRGEPERLLHEGLSEEVLSEGLQHPLHLALMSLDRAELLLPEVRRKVETDAEVFAGRHRRRVARVVDVEAVQTGNERRRPLRRRRRVEQP